MKIYTKTGDQGETGLASGHRLPKDHLRIQAYGDVDELNAVLGVCRSSQSHPEIDAVLHQLQRELFDLGADLATPLDSPVKVPRIGDDHVVRLEQRIDAMDEKLSPLRHFILPGGCVAASHLHHARTVCRRAERTIVALQKAEHIGENVGKYMNRLGDLLFTMARYANMLEKHSEEPWKP